MNTNLFNIETEIFIENGIDQNLTDFAVNCYQNYRSSTPFFKKKSLIENI